VTLSSLQIPIKAEQAPLQKIFGEDFIFFIPGYQRPFSWEKDNFQKLVEDLFDSMDASKGDEVYFLGTIVLYNKKGNEQEVIDGQQRLVSLAILFAVMRDLIEDSESKRELQECIYQRERELTERPKTERIHPWKKLESYFADHVYVPGGTRSFLEGFDAKKIDKEDPVYHLYEAIQAFYEKLSGLTQEQLKSFAKYVLRKGHIVYIVTSNKTRALKLFNTLNTRGLSLSPADIIKAANLDAISNDEQRDQYAKDWIALEEDLGRERLGDLLSHIRTAKAKDKLRASLDEEYEKLCDNGKLPRGSKFIDYLAQMSDIYRTKVLQPSIDITRQADRNRCEWLIRLMYTCLPFSDWVPPLLAFCDKFRKGEEHLPAFLSKLEKKTFVEWIGGFTETERITSFARITDLIESSPTEGQVVDNMLTHVRPNGSETKGRIVNYSNKDELKTTMDNALNDQYFYTAKGRRLSRYALLRLDMELWDLAAFHGYQGDITVEHVLPRTPQPSSEWVRVFDENQRVEWTNKLGNLVLLSGSKNPAAGTYDFSKKKEVYFRKKCSPFKLTQEIMSFTRWTPDELKQRQDDLVKRIEQMYLGA